MMQKIDIDFWNILSCKWAPFNKTKNEVDEEKITGPEPIKLGIQPLSDDDDDDDFD